VGWEVGGGGEGVSWEVVGWEGFGSRDGICGGRLDGGWVMNLRSGSYDIDGCITGLASPGNRSMLSQEQQVP